MSFKNKLLQLYARYDLNPTSLSRRLKYSSAEKIARLTRDEANQPSYQILQDLINEFKEIDPRWWFTEEETVVEDSRSSYGFCKECIKKEGVIEHIKRESQAKDKRIEELLLRLAQHEGRADSQAGKSKKAS